LQNGTDIRVLITNQNYPGQGGPFGAIPNDQGDPTGTNKIGIVEVPFIGPIRYTFAHEVAHHFGCWHSIPTIDGCPNGMNMANGRNTIMANSQNNTRIQHFSNPDVLFGGEATGIAGTRDNAAQIRGAFCEVADNVPGQYSVLISKNTIGPLCKDETYTFGANVSAGVCFDPFTLIYSDCATGPYQFEWRISNTPDFQNSQVISTAQTATLTISECTFYLRVTVLSANNLTITETKLFQCAPGVACERGSGNLNETYSTIQCTPNPAYDYLNVSYGGMGAVHRMSLVDVTGKVRSVINPGNDQREMRLDISGLEPGIWFLHLQSSEKEEMVKFSVIR
jgi:Secretion system C-terminal sorting domain